MESAEWNREQTEKQADMQTEKRHVSNGGTGGLRPQKAEVCGCPDCEIRNAGQRGSSYHADIDICVYGQGGVGKAGLIFDIGIEGNAFIGSGNAAISVKSAENVRIADNFIYKPCREVTDAPANCAVFSEQSKNVRAERNRIVSYVPDGFCGTAGC